MGNSAFTKSSLATPVSLANGGFGVGFSDPGAHVLYGYDNTSDTSVQVLIGSGLSYDAVTNTLSASGGGGGSITSVNGDTGPAVVLDTDDISDTGAAHKYNQTHTGDVTGATFLSIATNAVTFSKIQTISTNTLMGRYSASTGAVESITIGTGLSASGGTLSTTFALSSGDATINVTGSNPSFGVEVNKAQDFDWSGHHSFISYPISILDGTNDEHAVTLKQLTAVATGLNVKTACVVSTVSDISLFDEQTINGVAVVADDRVLVKAQSNPVDNGIWVVKAGGNWFRSDDYDSDDEVMAGTYTYVIGGTVDGNRLWVQIEPAPSVGSTAINFTQLGAVTAYTASKGVKFVGADIRADYATSDSGSGLMPAANLGTGTPSSTTALFGDQTYKTVGNVFGPGFGTTAGNIAVFQSTDGYTIEESLWNISSNTITYPGTFIIRTTGLGAYDINFAAADSDIGTNAGNITFTAGNATSGGSSGGSINFVAGPGDSSGGSISFTTGDSASTSGGVTWVGQTNFRETYSLIGSTTTIRWDNVILTFGGNNSIFMPTGDGTFAVSASGPWLSLDSAGNLTFAGVNWTDIPGANPISKGGTGQTTANAALNALLPSQTSNSGKVLQTNGTNTSWATVTAGAGGSTTQLQYNNAGVLAGIAGSAFAAGVLDISDTVFRIQNAAATTAKLVLSAASITAGNTRTLTAPNASGTIPLPGVAQTWTATQTFSGSVALNGAVAISASTTAKPAYNMAVGVSPTTPSVGDFWHDGTQKTLTGFLDGIKQNLSGVIFTSSTNTSVTATTTETTLLGSGVGTKTLPANFWVVGKVMRIKVVYSDIDTDATPGTWTTRLKYGATTLVSVAPTPTASQTNGSGDVEFYVRCTSVGATGTLQVYIWQRFGYTGVSQNVGSALTTVNTTTANALNVTMQFGNANAGNNITGSVATMEVLN